MDPAKFYFRGNTSDRAHGGTGTGICRPQAAISTLRLGEGAARIAASRALRGISRRTARAQKPRQPRMFPRGRIIQAPVQRLGIPCGGPKHMVAAAGTCVGRPCTLEATLVLGPDL